MTNIFVGNLSYQTTEDDLMEVFSRYGNVERVNVIKDRDTGQPRGFAFVEMSDGNEAQNAIEQTDGMEIRGRAVKVNEARPRPAFGGGGGGGYGGDRRPRGGGGGRDRGDRGNRY